MTRNKRKGQSKQRVILSLLREHVDIVNFSTIIINILSPDYKASYTHLPSLTTMVLFRLTVAQLTRAQKAIRFLIGNDRIRHQRHLIMLHV